MSLDLPPKKPRGGCLRILIGLILILPCLNALALLVPMWTKGFPASATGEERLLLQLFLGATVLVFGGGGLAFILSGGRAIGRGRALQAQVEAAHPNEPWFWRPDWASGRIPASDGPPIVSALVAVGWNSFALKVGVSALSELVDAWNRDWDRLGLLVSPAIVVPAVFVAIGLRLAYVATCKAVRWLRFRRVSFRLETVPGTVGGPLRGVVEARGTLPAGTKPVVSVSCTLVSRTGSGRRMRTRREIVWQEERPAHNSSALADGLSIPVDFSIPPGLPESSVAHFLPCHVWELRVRTGPARTDFSAEFEIPVFDTGARREKGVAEPPPAPKIPDECLPGEGARTAAPAGAGGCEAGAMSGLALRCVHERR